MTQQTQLWMQQENTLMDTEDAEADNSRKNTDTSHDTDKQEALDS